MNSKSYLVLNSWLQNADSNYIAGRLLWSHLLVVGASNLLWLSCEQLTKIVLLQDKVDEMASGCEDISKVHKSINNAAKKLGHNVGRLVSSLDELHPEIEINKYRDVLYKLHEYFFRRYPAQNGSSISLEMINRADALYFCLRSLVVPDVGVGTIDEIFIQRKHGWEHPLPAFEYAYSKNNYFGPRRHRLYRILGPDQHLYEEKGIAAESG